MRYNEEETGRQPEKERWIHMKRTPRNLLIALAAILLLLPCAAACGGGQPAQTNAQEQTDTPTGKDEKTEMNENTGTPGENDRELRVLFLGNSLIYYNDMPKTFEAFAKAAGKKIVVDSVTKGSATMAQFADRSTDIGASAYTKLTTQKWDFVIAEPSRRITPDENTILNAEIAGAKTLKALSDAAGAELLFYSVWGNNDGTLKLYRMTTGSSSETYSSRPISHQEHTAIMKDANDKVSAALGGVRLVPAGYAFENSMAAEPSLNLYYTDLRHPNAEGSYLAACLFYGVIYGERASGVSFDGGIASAAFLREIADKTVFDGLIPDLTPTPVEGGDFDLLVIGSNLLDNYSMLTILGDIMKEADGKTLASRSIMDSSFTFTQIAEEGNDLGVRAALAERKWDAIIVQLSRRNTISGTEVAASETAALGKIMPLLLSETPDVFIWTLNSDANPAIFAPSATAINYAKTSKKETCTAAEGTAYFTTLAKSMAGQLGCKTILYGETYHKIPANSKAKVGYMQACCLYTAFFGKAVPEDLTVTNGLSAADAAILRALVPEALK